ncbi:MAG: ATP-binding protein, partial [Acidimicrobiales bacterium]
GATSSVLLVDPDGRHLRHGAGPGLPRRFIDHIDGAEVGPRAGSCGTAVHLGERVVVRDIATDPLWTDYRELALSCGLRACWATPVRDGQGNVVASLAEYHAEPYEPDPLELQLSDRAATLLGLAIDRVRSDEALQRSNAMLTMASDLARLGWWTIDIDRMELTGSEVVREIHGLPPDHTPPLDEVILRYAPEDRDVLLKAVTECATNGTPYSMELRVLHPSGEERWVRGEGRAVTDADGRVVAIQGSSQDLTEQHHAEAAMRSMEAQLSRALRLEAVGQLTGGVAHDFNNLLTVILGNADLLARAIHDDELRGLVDATRVAAERGAELTQRMLAFARQQPLRPTPVGVGELVTGLEGMLTRTLGADVELEVEVEAGIPAALVDPAQLEAAILNLCLNARDAMPGGGHLRVEARSVSGRELDEALGTDSQPTAAGDGPEELCDRFVRIAVADSGIGMSPEVVERAFDPFFTTKEIGKGTGLGLSMVYGFIQRSSGQVRVLSAPGEGATVELYLPCTDADVVEPRAVDAPTGRRTALPGGDERILLVEDDELVRVHVAHQLHRLGYEVHEAHDADQALELLAADTSYDLLLTDIVMPGGTNGRELADLARQRDPELRVLFSSGYAAHSLIERGRLDDDAHLLTKPYTPSDLARVVREVLDEQTTTA